MGLNEGLPDGATPLNGEELEGLLPTQLVNRSPEPAGPGCIAQGFWVRRWSSQGAADTRAWRFFKGSQLVAQPSPAHAVMLKLYP